MSDAAGAAPPEVRCSLAPIVGARKGSDMTELVVVAVVVAIGAVVLLVARGVERL